MTIFASRRRFSRYRLRPIPIITTLFLFATFFPIIQTVSDASARLVTVPNYSPTSRTVAPVAVQGTSGTVTSPQNVLSGQPTRISGAHSRLVLDFGKEVGGIVTLTFSGASGAGQQLGLAFSESSNYIGENSDLSAGIFNGNDTDGAIFANVGGAGSYTMPIDKLRGGFRYLTLFLTTTGWVDLNGVSLNFTAAPGKTDPSAYTNYFSSNDDLLNKIWYAGAYTVQLDTIDPHQGRVWPAPATGWENNATIGVGSSILSDGAKRDRTVWSGDMGISLPTEYVTTNDTVSSKNALTTLYQHQNTSTGEFPYAGPQINWTASDTYHMWTLVGTSTYYLYSADKAWLDSIWNQYKLGVAYISNKIDGNGLLNVTNGLDWARDGQGGENIEANAILYRALLGGASLATAENDSATASTWTQRAATLKSAANSRLWNENIGMYRDNPTSTRYPQDGNSLAVWYGLTDSQAKNTSIANTLSVRWNEVGARTPEKNDGGAIGTFPGSLEVQAHFAAGDDINGLDLVRREWGYMLDAPIGTKSTFWEGMLPDGSFDYGGSYASAAHGWATGPTLALTFSVLGLSPKSAGGQFDFVPHLGDLTHVEGNITLPQGSVNGSWDYSAASQTLTQHLTSPAGSSGRIGVPTYGAPGVSVSVNGVNAWSGGTFHGAPGIGGGSTDGQYIYLTGVAPGTYTVISTGVGVPGKFSTSTLPEQLPPGYVRCATENAGSCTPTGVQVMAYGAGTYAYQLVGATTACSNAGFGGDPAGGVLKSCYLAPLGGPAGFTSCAAQNGNCAFTGTKEVAFGNNGAFNFQTATDGIACTQAAFGSDPLDGNPKSCYVATSASPPGNWSSCAAEGSSCTLTGTQPLAFGANGAYWSADVTGTTTCNNAAFGVDPIFAVVKACFAWTGSPSGYGTTCAAENGTCAFTGTKTVAYGARGKYIYKTFVGGTACTNAAFGGDPIFDTAKSCYLT